MVRLLLSCPRDNTQQQGGARRDRRGHPAQGHRARRRLAALGSVPQRQAVGHGPRGLQRRRRGLEPLHPRAGAQPGLPLGRGRHRRLLRHESALVPRRVAVERPRPHPQGAAVRPHQRRGQPRRGRQGTLFPSRRAALPRLHGDALPLPAGRLPLRAARRGERAARLRRPRVRARGHRHLRGERLLRRHRGICQGDPRRRADACHGREPRADGGEGLADTPVLGTQHLELGRRPAPRPHPQGSRRRRAACDATAGDAAFARLRRGRRNRLLRERQQSSAALRLQGIGPVQGWLPRLRDRRKRRGDFADGREQVRLRPPGASRARQAPDDAAAPASQGDRDTAGVRRF